MPNCITQNISIIIWRRLKIKIKPREKLETKIDGTCIELYAHFRLISPTCKKKKAIWIKNLFLTIYVHFFKWRFLFRTFGDEERIQKESDSIPHTHLLRLLNCNWDLWYNHPAPIKYHKMPQENIKMQARLYRKDSYGFDLGC